MRTLREVGILAWRSVRRAARQPANIIVLIFPLMLMAVNSSGLRSATQLPGFPTDSFLSFFLPFTLRRLRHGAYGVLLEARVARTLGRWLRLRSFQITLGRRYRRHGRLHSYLNAHCPLPPRFHSLSVPLARATFHFNPAPTLSTPILRSCRTLD